MYSLKGSLVKRFRGLCAVISSGHYVVFSTVMIHQDPSAVVKVP